MARRGDSRRAKERVDPLVKLERSIVTDAQAGRKLFLIVDAPNFSEEDQRASQRSGSKRTLRRKTKIDILKTAGIINAKEAAACDWYLAAHSMRYDTVGITAKYGEGSGGGCTNFDHLPKNREQMEAYLNFELARRSINPAFLALFERVVLHGRPLGKLAITFRTAARELLAQIEDRVAL